MKPILYGLVLLFVVVKASYHITLPSFIQHSNSALVPVIKSMELPDPTPPRKRWIKTGKEIQA